MLLVIFFNIFVLSSLYYYGYLRVNNSSVEKISDDGSSVAKLGYQKENYVNDRQNHCQGIQGNKGAKWTRALRCNPLSGTACKFNLTLLYNGSAFFIRWLHVHCRHVQFPSLLASHRRRETALEWLTPYPLSTHPV